MLLVNYEFKQPETQWKQPRGKILYYTKPKRRDRKEISLRPLRLPGCSPAFPAVFPKFQYDSIKNIFITDFY